MTLDLTEWDTITMDLTSIKLGYLTTLSSGN
jgi:hypothetical protein